MSIERTTTLVCGMRVGRKREQEVSKTMKVIHLCNGFVFFEPREGSSFDENPTGKGPAREGRRVDAREVTRKKNFSSHSKRIQNSNHGINILLF